MSGKAKILVVLAALGMMVGAQGAIVGVPFWSGQSNSDGRDVNITMATGPGFGIIVPTGSSDPVFDLAKLEPAFVLNPTHPYWMDPSDPANWNGDTRARWIGTTANGGVVGDINDRSQDRLSGMYAIKIENPGEAGYATLDLWFRADNSLGWPTDNAELGIFGQGLFAPYASSGYLGTPALYINGEPVVDCEYVLDVSGDRVGEYKAGINGHVLFSGLYLEKGDNWLYFNVGNYGGASGLLFSGVVTMVPEPMTMSLLAMGGLALLRRKRR